MGQLTRLQFIQTNQANRTSYTPARGEPLYEYENGNLYIGNGTTPGGLVVSGGGAGGDSIYPEMRKTVVMSNYTLLESDEVLMCMAMMGDITITLPEASTTNNNTNLHTYYIYHGGGDNKVNVVCSGTDVFPGGHNKIVLNVPSDYAHIGSINDAGMSYAGWANISQTETILQARRTTWAAANFSTVYTSIPFTATDFMFNDAILEHSTASNPERVVAKIKGVYTIYYNIVIDSTGGGSWAMFSRLLVNGTTEVAGSFNRTANFQNEDGFLSAQLTAILNPNDYIELQTYHTNLTGQILAATLSMRVTA